MAKPLNKGCHVIAPCQPQIYTNGAYLSPAKILISGCETWVWIVDQFEDDCFLDGELCCPIESADCEMDLLPDDLKRIQPTGTRALRP